MHANSAALSPSAASSLKPTTKSHSLKLALVDFAQIESQSRREVHQDMAPNHMQQVLLDQEIGVEKNLIVEVGVSTGGSSQESLDDSTDDQCSDRGLDDVHARLQNLAQMMVEEQKLTAALAEQIAAERVTRSEEISGVRENAVALVDKLSDSLAEFREEYDRMLHDDHSPLGVVRQDLHRATREWEASARSFEGQLQDLSQKVTIHTPVTPAELPELRKLAAAVAEIKGQVVAQRVECRHEVSRARMMAEESVAHAEKLAGILYQASAALDKRLNEEVLSELDLVRNDLRRATQEWDSSAKTLEERLQQLNQRLVGDVARRRQCLSRVDAEWVPELKQSAGENLGSTRRWEDVVLETCQ